MPRKKKGTDLVNKLNLNLKDITPLTQVQEDFFRRYDEGKSQLLLGYPGTGKTFLSLYKAFEELTKNKNIRGVVIVRSAVPTRDVGFLPGNLDEKGEIYELPYKQICGDLFGRGDAYEILKKHGIVTFLTTSYVRGITLDNVIVIVDELQNLTSHEADSVITRLGRNSKVLLCGDFLQTDFTKEKDKDIRKFVRVLQDMYEYFDTNSFQVDDIVRSGLVKEYIIQKSERYYEGY